MSVVSVLCEGPDDVTALRELARWFGGQPVKGGETAPRNFSEVAFDAHRVRLKAVRDAKTKLIPTLATEILGLPPQELPGRDDDVGRLAVVFDPDADASSKFLGEAAAALQELAKDPHPWAFEFDATAGRGTGSRALDGRRLDVRVIAWRAPGGVVDSLPDAQSLERLLCQVAMRAYPQHAPLVEQWLGQIAGTQTPKWKSALHLWCALVHPDQSETSVPAQLLKQDDQCKPHVQAVLSEAGGLWQELEELFRFD